MTPVERVDRLIARIDEVLGREPALTHSAAVDATAGTQARAGARRERALGGSAAGPGLRAGRRPTDAREDLGLWRRGR
jgi:hypothetical protein